MNLENIFFRKMFIVTEYAALRICTVWSSGTAIYFTCNLETSTCGTLKYKMDKSVFIVSIWMGKFNRIKGLKLRCKHMDVPANFSAILAGTSLESLRSHLLPSNMMTVSASCSCSSSSHVSRCSKLVEFVISYINMAPTHPLQNLLNRHISIVITVKPVLSGHSQNTKNRFSRPIVA